MYIYFSFNLLDIFLTSGLFTSVSKRHLVRIQLLRSNTKRMHFFNTVFALHLLLIQNYFAKYSDTVDLEAVISYKIFKFVWNVLLKLNIPEKKDIASSFKALNGRY